MLHVKQKPEGYLLSQAESTFAKFAQTKLSWIWGSFTSPGVNLSCQQIRDRVLDYTNCLMTDCRLTECSGRTIRKAEGGGWFLARKNFFSGRWPVQEFSFFFWVQPFVGFFFCGVKNHLKEDRRSYIRIIILSRVYNKPTQRPVPGAVTASSQLTC